MLPSAVNNTHVTNGDEVRRQVTGVDLHGGSQPGTVRVSITYEGASRPITCDMPTADAMQMFAGWWNTNPQPAPLPVFKSRADYATGMQATWEAFTAGDPWRPEFSTLNLDAPASSPIAPNAPPVSI